MKDLNSASVRQATTTVPVRTVLLGAEFLLVSDFLRALLEEESFQFFSLASSISICSSLHSLLQNGVFPLKKQIQFTKNPSESD